VKKNGEWQGASVEQLAGAMVALGVYRGDNTPAEHAEAAEAAGGPVAYRMLMVNALLGLMQCEAWWADSDAITLPEALREQVWEEQLDAAGAGTSDPLGRIEFALWQVLRAARPIVQIAEVWQGPLQAACVLAGQSQHQLLLAFANILRSHPKDISLDLENPAFLADQAEQLRVAHQSLHDAIMCVSSLLDRLPEDPVVTGPIP
jgi:hypothetical protein